MSILNYACSTTICNALAPLAVAESCHRAA